MEKEITVKRNSAIMGGVTTGLLVIFVALAGVNSCNEAKDIRRNFNDYKTETIKQIGDLQTTVNGQAARIDQQCTRINHDSTCIATFKAGNGTISALANQIINTVNSMPK